ncbi:hypothetical protein G9A89_000088 [Geosiphon pyriformis]|nr:hypothetical protein G9A89_000088 [Geosiphon pyriformis]
MIRASRLPRFDDGIGNQYRGDKEIKRHLTNGRETSGRIDNHGAILKRRPMTMESDIVEIINQALIKAKENTRILPTLIGKNQIRSKTLGFFFIKFKSYLDLVLNFCHHLSKAISHQTQQHGLEVIKEQIRNDRSHPSGIYYCCKPNELESSLILFIIFKEITLDFNKLKINSIDQGQSFSIEKRRKGVAFNTVTTSSRKLNAGRTPFAGALSKAKTIKSNEKLMAHTPMQKSKFTPFHVRSSFSRENVPSSISQILSSGPTPRFIHKRKENAEFAISLSEESSLIKSPYTPTPRNDKIKELLFNRHYTLGLRNFQIIQPSPGRKPNSPIPETPPPLTFEQVELHPDLTHFKPIKAAEDIYSVEENNEGTNKSLIPDFPGDEGHSVNIEGAEVKTKFNRPLTDEQDAEIRQIIADAKKANKSVAKNGRTEISANDLDTLKPGRYLNGEVISMYAKLLNGRVIARRAAGDVSQLNIFMSHTYFYELVTQKAKGGYKKLEKWLKNNGVPELFDLNMLIVPVHLANHWVCAVANITEMSITVYNSGTQFGCGTRKIGPNLLDFIKEYRINRNKDFDQSMWNIRVPTQVVPQQPNAYDCGVYTLLFADYISAHRESQFDFDGQEMDIYRDRIKYELVKQLPIETRELPLNVYTLKQEMASAKANAVKVCLFTESMTPIHYLTTTSNEKNSIESSTALSIKSDAETYVADELLRIFRDAKDQFKSDKYTLCDIKKWLQDNRLDPYHVFQAAYRKRNQYEYFPVLGFVIKHGIGVKYDLNRAFYWYELAAKNGDSLAQNEVGYSYLYGEGTEVNHQKAFAWFQMSAEAGNAFGQSSLAFCYKEGIGTNPKSYIAIKLYEKAAEAGYYEARTLLGTCYFYGVGTNLNWKKAFWCYHIAAAAQNKLAQLNLGYIYRNGIGLPKDIHSAIRFYNLALQNGEEEAHHWITVIFKS